MSEKTFAYRPEKGQARLIIYCNGAITEYILSGEQDFGRPSKKKVPDIHVPSGVVSRNHGNFMTTETGCIYRDAGSMNGTIYNGKMMETGSAQMLFDGDILRIHGPEDNAGSMDVIIIYSRVKTGPRQWKQLPLNNAAEICIGRKEAMKLRDRSVSGRHASFFYASKGWALIDHGSLNGVFRNGVRMGRPVYLKKHDVIRITDYYFIYTGDQLVYQTDAYQYPEEAAAPESPAAPDIPASLKSPAAPNVPASLKSPAAPDIPASLKSPAASNVPEALKTPADVKAFPDSETPAVSEIPIGPVLSIQIEERNVWQRAKKKTLLRDINLEIPAGSLVLILGGSGAGKTTFMNAVMGYEQAEGEICYAGTDIYQEYEQMKYEIGYVPQQDLVRMNDTVFDTLQNAARMRLPVMKKAQYLARVEETLHLLGLERLRDSLVGKLSGGQRKRLSIAIEYIGNPSLFFLDEPDSGLDGTMARQLMENLRDIANEGKICLVISHSPDRAFELFDRVIVLAKSSDEEGRLVFYGSPHEALEFFEVDCLEKIVSRINYPEEGGEGLADYFIERFERKG